MGRIRSTTCAILLCGSIGCGPRVMLAPPTTWPEKWAARHVYATPHAVIYASSAAAAGEADRFVADTARLFAEQTGGLASRGLVLVTDAGDKLLLPDIGAMVDLISRSTGGRVASSASAPGGGPMFSLNLSPSSRPSGASASSSPASAPSSSASSQSADPRDEIDVKIPVESVLRCVPFALSRAELTSALGFPAAAPGELT